jgi:hypothetical protein
MTKRLTQLIVLALPALFSGCEDALGDSAHSRWSVATVPSLVIGVDESRPGHSLHQVVGAVRLSDGRIAVANRGSSEVLIFGPGGELQRRVGGPGSGPDQIQSLSLLSKLPGDTMLALASDPAVVTITPEGVVLRKEPFRYLWTLVPCRFSADCGSRFLADGSVLVIAPESGTCETLPIGRYTVTTLIGRYDWRAGTVDTLAILRGPEWTVFRYGPRERQITAIGRPYGGTVVAAASSDRIFAAETGGDSIREFTASGTFLTAWPIPIAAMAVSDRAKAKKSPPPPREGTVGPSEPYDYPDHYPRLARLLSDETDHLWIMKYPEVMEPVSSDQYFCPHQPAVPDGGAEWIVLDHSGRPMAEVRTPPDLYVLEIGADYILGVRRDSLDVQSIAMHELRR